MVLDDSALYLDVVLTKGRETRTWHIGWSRLRHQATFRRSKPGLFTVGALPTPDAVEAKRREFEAEIVTARADGWIWPASASRALSLATPRDKPAR